LLIACWSVKGGSGTTVVAAALALHLARTSGPVLLADLAGELPAALGLPEPHGPGAGEWLASGDSPADALDELAVAVADGLTLLHRGDLGAQHSGERLATAFGTRPTAVVADCGILDQCPAAAAIAAGADHSLLVLRPCYLALRRAVAAPIRPSGIVLVTEPERALTRQDVEDVLGVPVRAEVPWAPAIARAVDAGLLTARLPRLLERAIRVAA
jgi:hypothetical protein